MPLDEDLTRYTAPPDTGFNPEKEETDIPERGVRGIGNYYGGLSIKMTRGVCHWSIENYDGEDWVEIPRYLFDAISQHLDES